METKDLPIVKPNLTQRGTNDDRILKMALVDIFKQFKEHRRNNCQITFTYDNQLITMEVRLLDVIDNQLKESKDTLHLDEIKKEGE